MVRREKNSQSASPSQESLQAGVQSTQLDLDSDEKCAAGASDIKLNVTSSHFGGLATPPSTIELVAHSYSSPNHSDSKCTTTIRASASNDFKPVVAKNEENNQTKSSGSAISTHSNHSETNYEEKVFLHTPLEQYKVEAKGLSKEPVKLTVECFGNSEFCEHTKELETCAGAGTTRSSSYSSVTQEQNQNINPDISPATCVEAKVYDKASKTDADILETLKSSLHSAPQQHSTSLAKKRKSKRRRGMGKSQFFNVPNSKWDRSNEYNILDETATKIELELQKEHDDDVNNASTVKKSYEWFEGFRLPLGADGRQVLLRKLRKVYHADSQYWDKHLLENNMLFNRMPYATVGDLFKLAYLLKVFDFAVRCSSEYGETINPRSPKKRRKRAETSALTNQDIDYNTAVPPSVEHEAHIESSREHESSSVMPGGITVARSGRRVAKGADTAMMNACRTSKVATRKDIKQARHFASSAATPYPDFNELYLLKEVENSKSPNSFTSPCSLYKQSKKDGSSGVNSLDERFNGSEFSQEDAKSTFLGRRNSKEANVTDEVMMPSYGRAHKWVGLRNGNEKRLYANAAIKKAQPEKHFSQNNFSEDYFWFLNEIASQHNGIEAEGVSQRPQPNLNPCFSFGFASNNVTPFVNRSKAQRIERNVSYSFDHSCSRKFEANGTSSSNRFRDVLDLNYLSAAVDQSLRASQCDLNIPTAGPSVTEQYYQVFQLLSMQENLGKLLNKGGGRLTAPFNGFPSLETRVDSSVLGHFKNDLSFNDREKKLSFETILAAPIDTSFQLFLEPSANTNMQL